MGEKEEMQDLVSRLARLLISKFLNPHIGT